MTILSLFTLGWLAGIAAATYWTLPGWLWLAGCAPGLLLALAARLAVGRGWRLPPWLGPAGLAACALALGGWRQSTAQPPLQDPGFVAAYNDQGSVTLDGVVWGEPEARDQRTALRVRVEALHRPGEAAPRAMTGVVLVSAPRFSEARLAATGEAEWRYGDRVRVTGPLETPAEDPDFSYRDYLARLGIYAQVRLGAVDFVAAGQGQAAFQHLFDFKAHALAVLARLFPEPHAALLSGILLGVEHGIPAEIKSAFSATGTSHIVAISGFNVALLVSLFMALFSRLLGANRGALVTVVVIAAYTLLVGAGASVVRAALMGGLGVIAQRLGRGAGGLNALAAAALAMTLLNPLTLWDVGFQLSASATFGLIVYGDRFQAAFQRWITPWTTPQRAARLAALAGELFLITLAAQVTTLPILAYYFRQVSLISLLANLVILPVQPAVMMLGGLALILGLIWLPLGQLAAWLTWPLTAYTLSFVDLFARVPGGSVGLSDVAPALVVLFYAGLFTLTWVLSRPAEQRPRWWAHLAGEGLPTGGAAGLGLVALLAWSTAFSLPEAPGRLRVTVLDVGTGDGVLIQTPSGVQVLVDGGPSGGALVRGLARHLPLFDARLDLLVIAGLRDENLGGLPDVLLRYQIDAAVVTAAGGRGAVLSSVLETLNARQVPVHSAADLPVFDLGDGVTLRVLADGREGSGLRLEHGRFAFVLPIGLTADEADALAARTRLEGATALLLTERAARRELPEAWLQAVAPRLVVATLDAGQAGALTPERLSALAGRTLLRTDQRGAVTVLSDGTQVWVECDR